MRTFTVGVRFHTAGCTSPPTKPTASAVKISMAARLLTPKGQTTPTDITGKPEPPRSNLLLSTNLRTNCFEGKRLRGCCRAGEARKRSRRQLSSEGSAWSASQSCPKAALLGLEQCQMEIASVEMKATWCEAELQPLEQNINGPHVCMYTCLRSADM